MASGMTLCFFSMMFTIPEAATPSRFCAWPFCRGFLRSSRRVGGRKWFSAVARLNVPARRKKRGLVYSRQTGPGFNSPTHFPKTRELKNHVLLNGSGVAAGDVDGDGWCDLYFLRVWTGPNVLYRNLGNGRFSRYHGRSGGWPVQISMPQAPPLPILTATGIWTSS